MNELSRNIVSSNGVQGQKEKERFTVLVSRFSVKLWIWSFHVVVLQRMSEKCSLNLCFSTFSISTVCNVSYYWPKNNRIMNNKTILLEKKNNGAAGYQIQLRIELRTGAGLQVIFSIDVMLVLGIFLWFPREKSWGYALESIMEVILFIYMYSLLIKSLKLISKKWLLG